MKENNKRQPKLMAMMIHENSCACVGSQLDLFTVPGTQTSQEKNTYVPHYPISGAANVALEFDVKAFVNVH